MPAIVHYDLVLYDVCQAEIEHDLSIFFRHELRKIRDEFEEPSFNWPDDDIINSLVQRADGLFIYAATVCRFIRSNEEWSPQDLLKLFITDGNTIDSPKIKPKELPNKSPTLELDEMYMQILNHSLRKVDNKVDKSQLTLAFRHIVGSIVVLSETLSATALARLLAVEKEKINRRLRNLRSVLDVLEDTMSPIRLLHPSLRDFLLDEQRCHDQSF